MAQKEYGLFGRLLAEALQVPEEQVDAALNEMCDNMRQKTSHPITLEQLYDAWYNERGSMSLSEEMALRFAYNKLGKAKEV